MNSYQPLADRMRPRTLDEIVGQAHLLEPGKFIDRMVKSGMPVPLILYGPAGTGKTSMAMAMAGTFGLPFHYINATTDGKKDMEKALKDATPESPVIVFIDEAHRFNTAQQDYLLPFTESGASITIMASTENPYHQIIPGLRSRMRILELKKLSDEHIKTGVLRAIYDKERGLGNMNVKITDEALSYVGRMANGDLRIALNAVEMAARSSDANDAGEIVIGLDVMAECLQNTSHHDKKGDQYYDLLAALQKSIQGSDPDAALHYAARLLEAGELDILMRRLVVIAHEDIGLAAPEVGDHAINVWEGVDRIGLPEGRILIGKLIVQMALSPKSNSAYKAMDKAINDVRCGTIGEIPKHMRDAEYESAKYLGNGVGYKYPHDYLREGFGGWVNQQYMPNGMGDRRYYQPIPAGKEQDFKKIYESLQKAKEMGL